MLKLLVILSQYAAAELYALAGAVADDHGSSCVYNAVRLLLPLLLLLLLLLGLYLQLYESYNDQ
jgi:hypothetical protein